MSTGKNKVTGRIGFINKKCYNEFIKIYPNSEISYEEYIKVLKESNTQIKNIILDNPIGFKLPYNLGYIAVNKFKQRDNYKVIDWVNTNKFKKVIPLFNFHSLGFMYKIHIYKNLRFKFLRMYKVDFHRLIKRELGKYIKSGDSNYLELDYSYFSKSFNIERILNN